MSFESSGSERPVAVYVTRARKSLSHSAFSRKPSPPTSRSDSARNFTLNTWHGSAESPRIRFIRVRRHSGVRSRSSSDVACGKPYSISVSCRRGESEKKHFGLRKRHAWRLRARDSYQNGMKHLPPNRIDISRTRRVCAIAAP